MNKPKKPAPKKPTPKPTTPKNPPPRTATFPVFWVALGVIVAIGIGIALISATGGDEKSNSNGAAGGSSHEFGKVTVTGTDLPALSESGPDAAVGDPIPTIDGENFSGQPVTIAPDGRPGMIVFLAHWCPHCNDEAPRLADALTELGGVPEDVDLVLVPTGSNDQQANWPPSQWIRTMELGDVPALVDTEEGTVSQAFGLTSYPYIVMYDAEGNLVERRAGEQAPGFFLKAFSALAAGAPAD